MGPEILLAFFATLGFIFWFILMGIWRIITVIVNIILIPFSIFNNFVRVKFWGLPRRKIDTNILKRII